jgi:glutathione S-transferase
MITVYGAWPTRSFRVVWALEELGLEYRVRNVDLRLRQEDAEFIGLNPAGFLPVMDDEGVVMVDSIAILDYLIARYNGAALAPPPADSSFPIYKQFLHLGESGLAAYLNIVVASRMFAPEAEKRNWGAQVAERLFMNRLTLVARQLAVAPMMAGEAFTAADISVTYALDVAKRLGLAGGFDPAVSDYHARMSSRSAYLAAAAASKAPTPA